MGISTSLKGFLLCLGVMIAIAVPLTALGFLLQMLLKPITPESWVAFLEMLPFILFLVGVLTSTLVSFNLNANIATHNNNCRFSLMHTGEYFKRHHRSFLSGLAIFFVIWILPESFHCPQWLVVTYQGLLCLLVNAALLHLQRFTQGGIYA